MTTTRLHFESFSMRYDINTIFFEISEINRVWWFDNCMNFLWRFTTGDDLARQESMGVLRLRYLMSWKQNPRNSQPAPLQRQHGSSLTDRQRYRARSQRWRGSPLWGALHPPSSLYPPPHLRWDIGAYTLPNTLMRTCPKKFESVNPNLIQNRIVDAMLHAGGPQSVMHFHQFFFGLHKHCFTDSRVCAHLSDASTICYCSLI